MRFAAGVDVGSTQTKAVVMQESAGIVGRALTDTGANVIKAAENAFHLACREARVDPRDVGFVVGTGYGRYKITFGNAQMTEISCHARGASYVFPSTRTVIDMGGQDAKAISIGVDGQVLDFVMNDKCAAGTGRFLANAADVMGITLDEVGPWSLQGTRPVKLDDGMHGLRRIRHPLVPFNGQKATRHSAWSSPRNRQKNHLTGAPRFARTGNHYDGRRRPQ